MPMSSGGFNKPQPIQNDGVGVKPLPPSILDRFRAMVKEREEELRVFGRGAVFPLSTDEIVRLYEIVLSELTTNSKPIITDLTIIAGEQRAHGEGIADAICARIIEVPVDQKLPSLYLLDSIVKNIGKEYTKHFSSRLPEVFCEAYSQVNPNMHPAMRHLFGTWSAVFPLSVLQKIEAQLQFSSFVNGQSSGLRASGSPRPPHGIHINPKYFEAQHEYGHSKVDTFGTEGVSPTGRAGLATSGLDAVKKSLPSAARIMRSSSPYKIGHAGSLSPRVEEFIMDGSPNRVPVRASPSRPGIDYELNKVVGRDEETSEWRKRNWQDNSNQQLKASAVHNYSSGLDLRGPRALITIKTWQNTEEEEFDWEHMTPALADRRQSNDIYSSLPPPGNLTARHSFTTNHAARLVTDYGGNLSKAQLSSVTNSSIAEDVPNISNGHDKIAGVLPNVAGPNDLTSRISPSFTRESLILPHQLSQSHFNAKEGGSLSENRSFLTAGEQKPPGIGNFSNTDMKFGGSSSVVSTFNSTYNSPANEIRSAEATALTNAWRPAKFQNSHMMPSRSALPPHMQIRGQFGMKNAFVDQIHSEQHLGSNRNMPPLTLPQIHNPRPGPGPSNMQSTAQPSLVQPNIFMAQEARQNLHLPSSAPIPSNTMVPHLNHGYLAQPQGPPIGTTSSLPIFNAPNLPFHVPRGPHPGTTQALPIGQNVGQVAPTLQLGLHFQPRRAQQAYGLACQQEPDIKNRKTKPSPKWFVSATMWLSGAEALGTETVPGFLPAENTVEKEEDEEMAVPADEDQNACALCGEPFDDYYSDDMEEWMYKGAVYMYAPAGSTVGMDRSQLGPIVHAKCRSDSHGVSSEDFKRMKGFGHSWYMNTALNGWGTSWNVIVYGCEPIFSILAPGDLIQTLYRNQPKRVVKGKGCAVRFLEIGF
ncbi:hypothetical protein DH2020_035448 [Rehmannia glutinosa]|uniref:CID domain-containing protein n=1 Tax=Rehmannia glutinosa TaxID=99300 RepID=A0ABR0V7L3_REHGL